MRPAAADGDPVPCDSDLFASYGRARLLPSGSLAARPFASQHPPRSGVPAHEPARTDRLRTKPAAATQSAETDVPGAGIVLLPERPPETSRADPLGSPCAGPQFPSKLRCPQFFPSP